MLSLEHKTTSHGGRAPLAAGHHSISSLFYSPGREHDATDGISATVVLAKTCLRRL